MPYKDPEKNKVAMKVASKKYYATHKDDPDFTNHRKETRREWYLAHREQENERSQLYNETYKEKLAVRRREYDIDNKEYIKQRTLNYLASHKDTIKAKRHKYWTDYKGPLTKQKRAIFWLRVLELYGDRCSCCGEDLRAFGTIEHINGGGSEHRKKNNLRILRDVIEENDKSKYRVTCWNCHLGAHHNGGICPHKTHSTLRVKPKVVQCE